MTALTFFPERFSLPFADSVHGKIFDLIDGPDQKVAIAAPRGWGKTSIVALALIARYILFRKCLDLNSGQIIAALYGCVQKLMAKVEQLEADYSMKKAKCDAKI